MRLVKLFSKPLLPAIIVMWVAMSCSHPGTPETAAKAFIKAMNDKNFEAAKELATENSVSTINLIDSLTLDREIHLQFKEIKTFKEMPGFAICRIKGMSGKDDYLNLVEEDGKWKVEMGKF